MSKPESSTLTSKGQIVVPAGLRKRLKLKPGTRMAISEENGRIIVQPLTRNFLDAAQGCIQLEPEAIEEMISEKKREEW